MSTTTTNTATLTDENTTNELYPLPSALTSMPMAEAIDAFDDLDQENALMPQASAEDLWNKILKILRTTERLGMTCASDLLTDQQRLLTDLAGPDELTSGQGDDRLENLHIYRNLVLAVAVAATGHVRGNLTDVYSRMACFEPRTCASRRSLTDDEILLLRVMALVESEAGPTSTGPLVYALVEAGMALEETSHFVRDDFCGVDDFGNTDTSLLARGTAQLEPRIMPLGCFGTSLLDQFTWTAQSEGAAPTKTLAYTGVHMPGSRAVEVTTRLVLDLFLNRAGLLQADVSATSVRMWRLQTNYLTFGPKVAQELSGYGHSPEGAQFLFRDIVESHLLCDQAGLHAFREALD